MGTEEKDPTLKKEQKELASIILRDAHHRPDAGGQAGTKINIISNLFPTTLANDLHITHYDVVIDPLVRSQDGTSTVQASQRNERSLPPAIMMNVFSRALEQMEDLTSEQRRSLGFDCRKNAVTRRELPFNERQLEVELESNTNQSNQNRSRLFRLKIQRIGQYSADVINRFISADSRTVRASGVAFVENLGRVLQSLNIIFRVDAIEQYRAHGAGGRRFFDPNRAQPISNGAEIWRGFFQSVLPLRGGLFLNLDVAFSPFLTTGPFLEVAARILNQGGGHRGGGGDRGRGSGRGRGGDRGFNRDRGGFGGGRGFDRFQSVGNLPDARGFQQIRKALRNVSIGFTHRPGSRPEKFINFHGGSARSTTFNRDGREITVEAYMDQVHNIRLVHPEWPCVVVGQRRSLVPPELCIIVGNMPIPPQKMSSTQVQEMIRISAQQPSARLQETMQWRRIRNYEENSKLQSWNVQVLNEPARLKARILPPPTVQYSESGSEQPKLGSGKWNLFSARFFSSCVTLITPVVINFSDRQDQDCIDFMQKLFHKCRQLGMRISVGQFTCFRPQGGNTVANNLNEAGRQAYYDSNKRMEPQIFFCFLNPQSDIYETIKRVACTELLGPAGYPTQCFNVRKAFNERGQDQYCSNVAMKVNIKLGGCNQIVDRSNDVPKIASETMMIGLDVRHPPPRVNRESVVAAVATLNGQGTRIGNQVMTQANPNLGHQQEAILNGRQIFNNLLKLWMEENKDRLPKNIIVFRDGVSQGEYMQVKELEVTQLKEACLESKFGKGYNPNIVYVIGTKRHRIRFFAQDSDDVDKTGNLPAGTVVDSDVVHPYVFEFYLQAHSGLVGTCRPAKYTILHDQMEYSSDDLQRLINSLCYSYQRATRSVSQVPMAKYAHFLAEKASYILYPDNDATETASSTGERGGAERRPNPPSIDLNAELNKRPRGTECVTLSKVPWFL